LPINNKSSVAGNSKTVSLILIFLLVILHGSLKAQEKPSFAGISSGFAIPYGNFRSTSLDGGSFALTGFAINAEGAWFFLPKWGVGASAGFNMNPLYLGPLEWEKVLNDPFLQDVSIRSEPFMTFTAMAGMYTRLPVWKQFFFTGKLLGGLLYGRTPYQLYKPTYFMVGPAYYEITPAKDWKFSWQAGAGILYDISPCVDLLLEGVIMYDRLSFNFKTASGMRTDVHTIALINTSLGVRIKI
jgi:hypothetical protein